MVDCKVFYSWQSDLPNPTNRSFIEKALGNAVKSIRNDDSIEVEPVVDRDTTGVPGSPDIASTIFSKIEQAHVSVCDISIINSGSESRPTPNPNVLIELGYAIKSLGSERIIMVMNTAFGAPEQLPFDLRMRRVLTYNVSQSSAEKAPERKQLEKKFQAALNTIFTDQSLQIVGEIIQPLSIGDQARTAIENAQPNQEVLTRKFMNNLVEQLDSIAPNFREAVSDQTVVEAIEQTIHLGVEFAHISATIASMNASNAAMALYKGFEGILSRYYTPIGFSGTFSKLAFDFYKFIGHEFFVIFISFLIREERWEIITEILDEELYIDKLYESDNSATVSFTYINSYLKSLEDRNQRLNLNRASIRADLLNDRHTQGDLAEVVPMQQFIDGDCFLSLRSELNAAKNSGFPEWIAWSLIYLDKTPRYLIEAYRRKYARKLLKPLEVSNIEILRSRMVETIPTLYKPFSQSNRNVFLLFRNNLLGGFDPKSIGTR